MSYKTSVILFMKGRPSEVLMHSLTIFLVDEVQTFLTNYDVSMDQSPTFVKQVSTLLLKMFRISLGQDCSS